MQAHPPSMLRRVTIFAFIAFALSVVIQMLMGRREYPPVPPAIVIALLAAACLFFARRQRWAGIIAFLVPLSLITGMTRNRWYEKLGDPATTGYPGIVLQWASLLVGFFGAFWLLWSEYFKRSDHRAKI